MGEFIPGSAIPIIRKSSKEPEYIPGQVIPRATTRSTTQEYIPGKVFPKDPIIKPTQNEATQTDEQLSPLDIKNVLRGNSLELISRIGWEKYRKLLESLSYSQFIADGLKEISQLETASQVEQQPLNEVVLQQNKEAGLRAEGLMNNMEQEFARSKGLTYFCKNSEGGNKFFALFRGSDSEQKKVTRFYVGINNRNAPEIFQSLFEELAKQDGLGNTDLALYKSNIIGGAEESFNDIDVQVNNIIIYVKNDNPETFNMVSNAITSSKKNHPEIWNLSMGDKAKLKRQYLSDFIIPIDDNVGFVEMSGVNSYHIDARVGIYRQLLGESIQYSEGISLEERSKILAEYGPANPGFFGKMMITGREVWTINARERRRKYMPALLFED